MKRTRKWAFVAQEAQRLAALGLAPKDIGARLGVNRSTVTRWIKAGKLDRQVTKAPSKAVSKRQTPAQWAADVRKTYDLTSTDDQLVTLATKALALSLNPHSAASVQIAAAGRFQTLVRQLALVARGADNEEPAVPVAPKRPAAAPERVDRPRVDPRNILTVAK